MQVLITPFHWLVRLRWCAIAGQILLVLLVALVFGVNLPLVPILAILLVTAFSNFLLGRISPQEPSLRPLSAAVLVTDVLLLTLLLYFSGGPSNPFSIVFLVHVVMAAVLLGQAWTWGMALLSSLCFAVLFFVHVPIEGVSHHHVEGSNFSLHLQGMWLAYALVAILVSYFVTRISAAVKERDTKVQELTLLTLKQERLASLTTLAAGAAHELGSPLSTIAIIAKELERNLVKGSSPELAEDFALIRSEIDRCKSIIDHMSGKSAEVRGEMPRSLSAEQLRELLLKRFAKDVATGRLEIISALEPQSSFTLTEKALLQALEALVKNAFDASPAGASVTMRIEAELQLLKISVEDQGCGMNAEVSNRLGEPFFTTKQPGLGMGLGVFLVRLIAERLGGILSFDSTPGRGTCAIFTIPSRLPVG